MDYGSLDTVIQKRERGYIWLEQRLKKNLAVTTLFVTACFLFILILEILYGTGGQKEEFRIGFFSVFCLLLSEMYCGSLFLTGRNTENICRFKSIWKHLKMEIMNIREQKMGYSLESIHR